MPAGEITQLLQQMNSAEDSARKGAYDNLLALVYDDLRARARRQLSRERTDSLRPTGLVNEAYEKLLGYEMPFENREHFFHVAAHAMRRILIEHARKFRALKRGGGQVHAPLEDDAAAVMATADPDLLIDIDRAMENLRPDQVRMVELRFFVGLTLEETAEILDLKLDTAKKRWLAIKTLLFDKLRGRRV